MNLMQHVSLLVEFYFRGTYLKFQSRFMTLFSHDSDSMPRIWTGKEDVRAITKSARSSV